MKPGIYSDITNEDYHSGPGASCSMLKLLHERTPAHLKASRDARAQAIEEGKDDNESAALLIGTAFHAIVLEPEVFAKEFCLALRPQDVPGVIESRDELVALVEKLNEGRLDKLSASGTKDELVARIIEAQPVFYLDAATGTLPPDAMAQLQAMKLPELKAVIGRINESRPGKLRTTGTMDELATILAENGQPVKVWKLVLAEWMANNGHRKVLTPDQWDAVHRMYDAVMAHPAASKLLNAPGVVEHSAYAVDDETGELVRVRPDFWRMDGIVVDLKSTEDASPEGFRKSIAKFGYDVQHPMYLSVLRAALTQAGVLGLPDLPYPTSAKKFVFVACEKRPPYAVGVYALDRESQELGYAKYRGALKTYAACVANDNWPAYSDKVEMISLPEWHKKVAAEALGVAA